MHTDRPTITVAFNDNKWSAGNMTLFSNGDKQAGRACPSAVSDVSRTAVSYQIPQVLTSFDGTSQLYVCRNTRCRNTLCRRIISIGDLDDHRWR